MVEEPQTIDEVAQLRYVGVGLVIGGAGLAGGSFLSAVPIVAGLLVAAGIAVWVYEWQQRETVGVGIGIAMCGVLLLIEAASEYNVEPLQLAAFAVGAGVLDYVLAPWYVAVRDKGEQTRNRE